MSQDPYHSLNPRQQAFVDAYVTNPTCKRDAALAAGYEPNSASAQASSLLKNPKVAAAIASKMLEREERTSITQDRVLVELALLCFSDVRDYKFDEVTMDFDLIEGVPEAVWRAVSSIEHTVTKDADGETVTHKAKIKLWDKPSSIKLLMTHMGMLVERIGGEKPGDPIRQEITFGGEKITL